MDPRLRKLAEQVGIRIEERSCDRDFLFDGETLATHFYPCEWVGTGKFSEWGTEEEDFVRRKDSDPVYLSDHDFLHEIMHYLVAAPEQLDLQEYGLGYTGSYNQEYCPDVADAEEAYLQEKTVQLLCCYVGSRLGLRVDLIDAPGWDGCSSWPAYYEAKSIGESWTPSIIERGVYFSQLLTLEGL